MDQWFFFFEPVAKHPGNQYIHEGDMMCSSTIIDALHIQIEFSLSNIINFHVYITLVRYPQIWVLEIYIIVVLVNVICRHVLQDFCSAPVLGASLYIENSTVGRIIHRDSHLISGPM